MDLKPSQLCYSVACFIALLSLFFIRPPIQINDPWSAYLWDLGHVVIFLIIARLFYFTISPIFSKTRIIATLLFCLFLGTAIEAIQFFFEREPSFNDILLDISGAIVGLFSVKSIHRNASVPVSNTLKLLCLCAFSIILWKPYTLIVDKCIAYYQLPTLIDFSIPFATTRITGSAQYEVSSDSPYNQKALSITFNKDSYSTLNIERFAPDWQKYQGLHFELYLTGSTPLRINFTIADHKHLNATKDYQDRFTGIYQLTPGNNNLYIPLFVIQDAPLDRRMDLSNIKKISLYTMSLPYSRKVFLKGIRLL